MNIGFLLSALPGPCEGHYGARRTFKIGAPWHVKLEVPDAVQEKFIRWMLRGDPGVQELEDAYRRADASYLIPEKGMQACIYDVLRTKAIDPSMSLSVQSGWGNTCSGFFDCFSRYVEAMRRDNQRGRIDLPSGITVPSPAEELCIKTELQQTGNLAQAYNRCEVADIVPPPEILAAFQDYIFRNPGESFYEMLKVLSVVISKPPVDDHIPIPPPDDEAKKPNYLLYAAAGMGVAFLLSR